MIVTKCIHIDEQAHYNFLVKLFLSLAFADAMTNCEIYANAVVKLKERELFHMRLLLILLLSLLVFHTTTHSSFILLPFLFMLLFHCCSSCTYCSHYSSCDFESTA